MEGNPITIEIMPDDLSARINFEALLQQGGLAAVSAAFTGLFAAGLTFSKGIIQYKNNDASLSQKGFDLITKALIRASGKQSRLLLNGHSKDLEQKLIESRIPLAITTLEVRLTPELFALAPSFPFLDDFLPVYQQWLITVFECTPQKATQLINEFPELFQDSIAIEWCSNVDYYTKIHRIFNHPFSEALQERHRRKVYHAELKELYHQPTFNDQQLLLSHIYIEPDYNWYKSDDYGHRQPQLVQWLTQQLPLSYPKSGDKRLFFLLGQPGQGKTSTCYRLVHDLLHQENFNKELYLLKFRDLSARSLLEAPFDTLQQRLKRVHKLSAPLQNEASLVLILDGLDELYMSSGLTNNALQDFYHQLQQQLSLCKHWMIVVTSRHQYIHEQALDLNRTHILKLAPMTLDQQKSWLSRYQDVHPKVQLTAATLTQINEEDKLTHVKELMEQPILLHIIAANDGLSLDANTSRASLYKELFDTIIQKSIQSNSARYQKLQQPHAKKIFRHWLQELAFAIYQSEHLYLSYERMEALEVTQTIHQLIPTAAQFTDALKDLLVAFYFKKSTTQNNHPAIEFLHQSLQEYLIVEYVLRQLQEKLLTPDGEPSSSIDPQHILTLFHGWFAHHGLTPNLRSLIIEQIAELPHKKALREALRTTLDDCLQHQFLPTYSAQGHLSQRPPVQQIAHTFQSYWWILAHLDPKQNSDLIHNANRFAFLVLIQLPYQKVPLFLAYTNLSNSDLSYSDLTNADLRHANLSNSNLSYSYLTNSNLKYAYLENADLRYTDLTNADLRHADLRHANLRHANLRHADLRYANLSNTD